MTERIDHVARALEAIKYIEEQTGWMEFAPHATAVATSHATLALVEQQRIANLITLGEQWQDTGHPNADSMCPVFKPEIQAALGIE